MYLVLVLITVTLIWFAASYYKWWRDVYYNLAKIPGPRRVPLLGTLYMFAGVRREDLMDVVETCANKYRPLYCLWYGWRPEIHVGKPEHIEIILNNTVHIVKGAHYEHLRSYFGDGLATSKGSKWVQRRKIITPTFSLKLLKEFLHIFTGNTKKLIDILDAKADGKTIEIFDWIDRCAVDIIVESAMGVSVNAMFAKDHKYIKAIKSLESIMIWKVMHPYVPDLLFRVMPRGRAFQKYLKVAQDYTASIIRSRKEVLKNKTDGLITENVIDDEEIYGKKRYLSFLDMLLEVSETDGLLEDDDIREEVNTFTVAGSETVSTTVTCCILLLGNCPEAQEKAFAEVRDVLQDRMTPESLTEISDLKYLECVIKESLRMFPPVPFITRNLQTDLIIDGHKIPAGTDTFFNIYNIHRNAEYYPNPEEFDPSRFLPENSTGRHPYVYLPFSAGPRNCIGLKFGMYEAKTILASIVNRYKITAIDTPETIKLVPQFILTPINGVFVKLERRK